MEDLFDEIQLAIDEFLSAIPSVEKKIYASLITELKELQLYSDGYIKNHLSNILKIKKIKKRLEKVILDKTYTKTIGDFLGTYTTIAKIQDEYFSSLTSSFGPKRVFDEVKKQAIESTAESLTEAGVRSRLILPIKDIVSKNIKSGVSYADLTEILRGKLIGEDSILQQYAKKYAVDSINTFSRQYGQIITDDLGLDWFEFSGSLLTTSRPMCQAMHKKRYFHRSEFPDLVKGIVDGEQTPVGKDGMPLGFKEGTTPENYLTNLNGWNCAHQLIAVSKAVVPEDVLEEVEW